MIKMNKIKGLSKIENRFLYLKIENETDLNKNLSNLFKDLKFGKLEDLDLFYPELDEEYLFISDKKINLHLFITKKYVHLVIEPLESNMDEVLENVEKHFKLE